MLCQLNEVYLARAWFVEQVDERPVNWRKNSQRCLVHADYFLYSWFLAQNSELCAVVYMIFFVQLFIYLFYFFRFKMMVGWESGELVVGKTIDFDEFASFSLCLSLFTCAFCALAGGWAANSISINTINGGPWIKKEQRTGFLLACLLILKAQKKRIKKRVVIAFTCARAID